MGTKFPRSHVFLHSQAGNSVPITSSMAVIGSCLAYLLISYIFKITVTWLCSSLLCIIDFSTETDAGDKIKYYRLSENTKRQQENRPADSIGQKGFLDNIEDLRNAIVPYFQILKMEKNCENILK